MFYVYLADKDLQVSIIGDLDAAKAIKSSGKVVGKWFLKKISIQGSHLILEWCHSDTSLKKNSDHLEYFFFIRGRQWQWSRRAGAFQEISKKTSALL